MTASAWPTPGADRERLEHLAGVDAQRSGLLGGGGGLPVGEQLEGAAPLLQVLGDGRHHRPPARPRAAAANWSPSLQGHAAVVAAVRGADGGAECPMVEPGGALVGCPDRGPRPSASSWRKPGAIGPHHPGGRATHSGAGVGQLLAAPVLITCLGGGCPASGLYGPVGPGQVRLGVDSGESGLVRCSTAWWNDRQNDHLSKR
jgi:hypothetical protein